MKQSLRRMQYLVAMTGDKTMLIWLGKQYLGQTEKTSPTVDLSKLTIEQLQRIAEGEDPSIVAATPSSSDAGTAPANDHVN